MTNSPVPHKSKSFQDCKETEIHGYNDSPSFLFNVSKKSGRKNRLQTVVKDTYGSTKLAVAPPPMSKRTSSASVVPDEVNNDNLNDSASDSELTEDDILNKINELISKNSKLSTKEYDFYKRKVDLNLPKNINNHSTKVSLSQFLDIADDKAKQAEFLRKWMLMDITISNWCPAFLKLVENVDN